MIETPFKLGDVMWLAQGNSRRVDLLCPVCAGQLWFTVEFASGERTKVLCTACERGFEGPRGTIQEWVLEPTAQRFEIAEAVSFTQKKWRVRSTTDLEANYDELFSTEAEATAEATKRAAELEESNMRAQQNRKADTKRGGWSVVYHRQQIKKAEASIAWHRKQIGEQRCKFCGAH